MRPRVSALYAGHVRHRRFAPVAREFRYPLYMSYLALDELDACQAALWPLFGVGRPALTRFVAGDHLAGPGRAADLDARVRDAVVAAGAPRPRGPIDVLTHVRHLGVAMNPVSLFYCWNPARTALDAVVAEVSNTPWNQRHLYVLPSAPGGARHHHRFAKAFHVSPFLPMDLDYDWHLTTPGPRLAVHMRCLERRPADRGAPVLDATLTLARRPLERAGLARLLARFPLATAQVLAAIYGQAARLWLAGTPCFAHPRTRTVLDHADAVASNPDPSG